MSERYDEIGIAAMEFEQTQSRQVKAVLDQLDDEASDGLIRVRLRHQIRQREHGRQYTHQLLNQPHTSYTHQYRKHISLSFHQRQVAMPRRFAAELFNVLMTFGIGQRQVFHYATSAAATSVSEMLVVMVTCLPFATEHPDLAIYNHHLCITVQPNQVGRGINWRSHYFITGPTHQGGLHLHLKSFF